ncbi:MAG: 3-phosphoshikimate 1-carboxyvinyltransferase, partial [Gemmatimonadota bacterium]|nr:3-phosphoshikimate 1-carboxyvinyltransferase [Gemmatimonadota bacterium]
MKERGTVRVPGDKSISHRALILAALSTGKSRICGILQSADLESTAAVLRSLGARIPELSSDMRITGRGLSGLEVPATDLDAGNSGTTVRLMSGVVAAHPFASRFTGDASLSRRPMKRIAEPLTAMGARVEFDREDGLPMTIHGGDLSGISWNTKSASAQTKSAILLAGLVGRVPVTIRESRKSRDHTERMLASLGAPVFSDELTTSLAPVTSIGPLDIVVPRDPSSAAYFVALGVLGRKTIELPEVCINPTRTGFLEVMRAMGGRIGYKGKVAIAGDSVATVIASPGELVSIAIDPGIIPSMIDELPLLACVAAASDIVLEIRGAAELRVKESDRISSTISNLRAIGVDAEELPDGFIVRGRRG